MTIIEYNHVIINVYEVNIIDIIEVINIINVGTIVIKHK